MIINLVELWQKEPKLTYEEAVEVTKCVSEAAEEAFDRKIYEIRQRLERNLAEHDAQIVAVVEKRIKDAETARLAERYLVEKAENEQRLKEYYEAQRVQRSRRLASAQLVGVVSTQPQPTGEPQCSAPAPSRAPHPVSPSA